MKTRKLENVLAGFLLATAFVVIPCLSFTAGCAGLIKNPASAEAKASLAAETITDEILLVRPDLDREFQMARSQLAFIELQDEISVLDVIGVIERVPVVLQNEKARIAVVGTKLLVILAGDAELPAQTTAQLRIIVRGLGNGIDKARMKRGFSVVPAASVTP